MQSRPKYQTLTIEYLNGQAAGTQSDDITFENGYDYCDGVAVHVITSAGTTAGHFEIGLKDDYNDHHEIVHAANFVSDAGVAPNDKFKDVFIPNKQGQKQYVLTYMPDALAGGDLKYQVVYRLRQNVVSN